MGKKDYSNYTKEELIKEVESLKKQKTYGLVWEEDKTKENFDYYINWDGIKNKELFKETEHKFPVIKEIDKEIKTASTSDYNIIIEGDNYHSLAVLNFTHAKSIDIIYIDPPYNTGSKDWRYNNDYVQKEDNYRHSKWLSFMEKRLKLSKNLLKKNGVLICTIDENEHSTLGILLQEIFFNYEIVCVTIVHNPGGIQGNNFSYCHEYAYFVYPSNGTYISKLKRENIQPTPLRDWGKESSKRTSAKNCFYPILVKENKIIGFGDVSIDSFHPKSSNIKISAGVIEVYPVDKKGIERKWRFSRQSVEGIQDELTTNEINGEITILREKENYRWKTVWTDTKYNANVYGTKLLGNILKTKFPFPKSLYAVEDCLRAVIHPKNATILDFFAGSGTTGHAVLNLNQEDGGNRKFILCTNNENDICTEVTYPRIKKVIQGYVGINDKKNYAGMKTNLKYYKTDFVDSKGTDKNKRKLVNESTDMICIKESAFEKVIDKEGFKIFKNDHIYLGIIFDEDSIADFVKESKKINNKFNVYIFSLDASVPEDEFKEIKDKVTLCPIPEVILQVYRRVFKND